MSASSSRGAPTSGSAPLSLKQRIHAFKIPLSPRGIRIARVVYFTVPIVVGVGVMQFTTAYEERHRMEWADRVDAVAEVARTQHQLNQLKDIAHDSNMRLP